MNALCRLGSKKAWMLFSNDDHVLPVGEGDRPLAVGDAAHGLVAELRDHEQTELAGRVAVPLRKPIADFVDRRAHDRKILVTP